mgnify:CR=1 FL=1
MVKINKLKKIANRMNLSPENLKMIKNSIASQITQIYKEFKITKNNKAYKFNSEYLNKINMYF